MEAIAVYIFILSVPILAILVYTIFSRKKWNLPPGPTAGYRIFGNLPELDKNNIHLTLQKWAKQYGDIYMFRLFGNKILVLNSSNIVRKAMMHEPYSSLFADRPPNLLASDVLHGCSGIAFGAYNKDWMKRRKIGRKCLIGCFNGLQAMDKFVNEQLEISKIKIKHSNGELFDPAEIVNEFLVGIIASLISGRRHECDSEFIQTILEYNANLNRLFSPENIFLFDIFPFIKYIPGKFSDLYQTCKLDQSKFINLIREESKQTVNKGVVHIFYKEMGQINPNNDGAHWLTEESIFAILTDMVGGGILTSKGVLLSAIYIILYRQDVQKSLQNEIDYVIGTERSPCVSDKVYMPYTEAFILETLRFISHVPLLIPRHLSADTNLEGYDVPKGTIVLVNAWTIHFNNDVFKESHMFKPERFLDNEGNLLPADDQHRRNLLAFGIGKRGCIGESFAKNNIFLFISTMLQSFTFSADYIENGENLSNPCNSEPNLIKMPKRFICRAKQRRECVS